LEKELITTKTLDLDHDARRRGHMDAVVRKGLTERSLEVVEDTIKEIRH
jgi:hypothetical protein